MRAAVLSNTAAKIGTDDDWRDRIATVRAGGIEAIADEVMERWFTRAFRADRADELALWRNMLTRTPLDGYRRLLRRDLATTDLRASTAGLRLPVARHRRLGRRLHPARPGARDRRDASPAPASS